MSFNLLPKVHKRLYDVPARPVISNWFLHRKYFLFFRLSFTASCLEGKTLRKIKELGQLLEGTILCTIMLLVFIQISHMINALLFERIFWTVVLTNRPQQTL